MLRTGQTILFTAALSAPAFADATASVVLELGRGGEVVRRELQVRW